MNATLQNIYFLLSIFALFSITNIETFLKSRYIFSFFSEKHIKIKLVFA